MTTANYPDHSALGALHGDVRRRLAIGAEVAPGGVSFRVWGPRCKKLEVVVESRQIFKAMNPEPNGYFAAFVEGAQAGDLYRFRIDEKAGLVPDPASRFQPEGPDGPSMVIDPQSFIWNDRGWCGVGIEGQIFYEIHIGTFTPEGTWAAATRRLGRLKNLGVTIIEVMPVGEFSGRFGWGYDGVDFFSPTHLYGLPDDFRAFIDHAHLLGLGVILDVVYNHAGPTGNYLKCFSADYFTARYTTDWGEAVNFDGENAGPVREYFVTNVQYWIDEFHLDGLRLDATQNIYDQSGKHILREIAETARRAAGERGVVLVAENEPQDVRLIEPLERQGYGLDGLWNDDFHHAAVTALTGHNEAYYSDYRGRASEFVAAAKRGFIYQGQFYRWQNKRRGTPTTGVKPAAFIHYLENHDQIANLGRGLRIHQSSHPGMYRAFTALLLLGPQTPLLFQGQEYCLTTPFVYFADHAPDLNAQIKEGRLEFLSQFPSMAHQAMQSRVPDPTDPAVFERCRLHDSGLREDSPAFLLHRDLIKLRREDPVFASQRPGGVDGAVLDRYTFVLRFFADDGCDRLMIINCGGDKRFTPMPEPLLAPVVGTEWRVLWSSEDPKYDGGGAVPTETSESWLIPGRAAFVFKPEAP